MDSIIAKEIGFNFKKLTEKEKTIVMLKINENKAEEMFLDTWELLRKTISLNNDELTYSVLQSLNSLSNEMLIDKIKSIPTEWKQKIKIIIQKGQNITEWNTLNKGEATTLKSMILTSCLEDVTPQHLKTQF